MYVSLFEVIKLINRQSRRLHFLSLQTLQNFLHQNAHLLLLFFKAINILSSTQHDICHSLTYLHHIFKENKIFISAAAMQPVTTKLYIQILKFSYTQVGRRYIPKIKHRSYRNMSVTLENVSVQKQFPRYNLFHQTRWHQLVTLSMNMK